MPSPTPAPILDLPPRWGYRREVTIAAKSLRMGDNYSFLTRSGPRPLAEQVSIAVPVTLNEDLFPVLQLLKSLEGVREFQWSPNGLNRRNYICESWQSTPAAIGYARFAATFERWNGVASLVPKPAIPPEIDMVFNWETIFSDTAIVNERRVGEGVDRRASLFKNPIQRSFSVRVITLDEPGIDLFLSDLYGSPFRLKAINQRLNEPVGMLFNCLRWSFEGLGVGVSRFEAEFNQIYRP